MANWAKDLAASKAQRDAAKALITSDVDFIKDDVSARGVKDRAVNWSKERPPQLGAQAMQFVQDNPGKIVAGAGAVIGAIALIAFRKPIADLAIGLFEVLAEMEELDGAAEAEDLESLDVGESSDLLLTDALDDALEDRHLLD